MKNTSGKLRAVVTGGAGFIGSHLAEELLGRGYRVTIVDDLSTGKLDNIAHLLDPAGVPGPNAPPGSPRPDKSGLAMTEGGLGTAVSGQRSAVSGEQAADGKGGVEFIEGSITDLALLKEVFRGVQYVFHQAAIPSVPRSIENPAATHEVNMTGTLNVLLAAKEAGVRKVVYASSCAVYGDNPMLPLTEDAQTAPQSPYAVSKLAGEHYCRVFHQVYGLPTASLRYFNVYGPRQDPDSDYAAVIPRFIRLALGNRPPVIYGDGEQTRDFVFIRDVVEANILAAEGDAAGVFNIGRGERISVNRLAGLVIGLAESKVRPEHQEARSGDIMHSLADISRARAFGYDPRYSLEQGLQETIVAMRGP